MLCFTVAKHDEGTLVLKEGTFIVEVPSLDSDEDTLMHKRGTLPYDESTLTVNEGTF